MLLNFIQSLTLWILDGYVFRKLVEEKEPAPRSPAILDPGKLGQLDLASSVETEGLREGIIVCGASSKV